MALFILLVALTTGLYFLMLCYLKSKPLGMQTLPDLARKEAYSIAIIFYWIVFLMAGLHSIKISSQITNLIKFCFNSYLFTFL